MWPQGPFRCADASSHNLPQQMPCFFFIFWRINFQSHHTGCIYGLYFWQGPQHNSSLCFEKLISTWQMLHPSLSHKRQFVSAAPPNSMCFIVSAGFIEDEALCCFWGISYIAALFQNIVGNFSHSEPLCLFFFLISLSFSFWLPLTNTLIGKWGYCKILSGCV